MNIFDVCTLQRFVLSDLRIGSNNFEGFFHLGSGSTTSNVEKVGRCTTMKFDDVHRGHGCTKEVANYYLMEMLLLYIILTSYNLTVLEKKYFKKMR